MTPAPTPDDLGPLAVKARNQGDARILELSGEISMHAAHGLEQRLADEIAAAPRRLILDLSGLRFVSTIGLGTLVTANLKAKKQHIDLRVCGARDAVANVLAITRLDELFNIAPDVNKALEG